MVYLLHKGRLSAFHVDYDVNLIDEFNRIRQAKEAFTVDDLCFDNSIKLKEFHDEVFSYGFKDKPRYDYLRELLQNLCIKGSL